MADRELRRFFAFDDQQKRYEIIERIEVTVEQTFQSPPEEVLGFKSYRLIGGGMLNKISDTEFEIVDGGKRVRTR